MVFGSLCVSNSYSFMLNLFETLLVFVEICIVLIFRSITFFAIQMDCGYLVSATHLTVILPVLLGFIKPS